MYALKREFQKATALRSKPFIFSSKKTFVTNYLYRYFISCLWEKFYKKSDFQEKHLMRITNEEPRNIPEQAAIQFILSILKSPSKTLTVIVIVI